MQIVSGIGRIDVDEPLHVLSRGQYRADRTALATAAVNLATNRKAGASNGASNAAATGATAPDLQLGHRTGLETTKTAPEVLLNAGNSPGGIGSEMTNFMGSFSRNRAAAAAARAKGLRVALQNLKSDFDVVSVQRVCVLTYSIHLIDKQFSLQELIPRLFSNFVTNLGS